MKSITDQGIYSFTLGTSLESPTGFWRAEIKVGPHTKTKTIRVETIRPNVVDIQFDLKNSEKDWVYSDKFEGDLKVDYLAGYPLKGGKVQVASNIRVLSSPFPKFKRYRFLPIKDYTSRKEDAFLTATTNSEGSAAFNVAHKFRVMEGASHLLLDCKIDLPGGGLNTMTRSFMVSPYKRYVGIQEARGRGWRGSFRYDEVPDLHLVHVDQKGERLKGKSKVKIIVYKYIKDWWYDRYRLHRDHNYHAGARKEIMYDAFVEFVDGEYSFTHDSDRWGSGSFLIVAEDKETNHRSEYRYHKVNSQSYAADLNPQILQLVTDKDSYETGETMKIEMPVLPEAKALVSIEVGEKILDAFWADLNAESLELEVKQSWTPNIYLNVHIVQNYEQVNNDRPLRMYGIKKIKINTSGKALDPVIEAPEKSRPNSTLTVEVSEKKGQPMEYTIAVVDQGLLNITGFNTPDPQDHFNKLIALRIKTWDIFAELIRYINPSFAGIVSIGGDESINNLLDESADFNRFKPVVFHQGPFKLKANANKKHEFQIPNYIGKVRVMVVATGGDRYGHEEQDVKIASPLMIQSQLPRALNVSDKVIAPITLFRDEDEVRNVQLDLESENNKLEFESKQITASFDSEDQMTTKVPITVKESAGTAQLKFSAKSGRHKATEETKIFVNYPNSYSSTSEYLEVEPGQSADVNLQCFGFEETQHLDLMASGSMMPDFISYYEELIKYPHGCLEQLTSKGFALLYIDKIVQLSPEERKDAQDYLDAAILKIQSYQDRDGKFGYWPGGYYNVWADLYAGLFLHNASSVSRTVSEEAISRWARQNIQAANTWRIDGTMSREYLIQREEVVQAYRLYVLAKSGHAQKGAMNRFRNRTSLTSTAIIYLAGAYGHAGLTDIGRELMNSVLGEENPFRSYYYWGSSVRNRAELIAISSELFPDLITRRYYQHWVEDVNDRPWMSTQEMGQAFRACYYYLGEGKAIADETDFEIQSEKFNERHKMSINGSHRFLWKGKEIKGQAKLINHGKSTLYLRRIERAISKELYSPASSNELSIDVSYSTPAGNLKTTKAVEQGDEINITVVVTNLSNVDLDYMALTLKAPSGWELLNPRIFETAQLRSDAFQYQDYRDDKVYTYFDLRKSGNHKSRVFRFKARAQLLGDYYLPAVRVADMYDLDVFAQTMAQRVVVK